MKAADRLIDPLRRPLGAGLSWLGERQWLARSILWGGLLAGALLLAYRAWFVLPGEMAESQRTEVWDWWVRDNQYLFDALRGDWRRLLWLALPGLALTLPAWRSRPPILPAAVLSFWLWGFWLSWDMFEHYTVSLEGQLGEEPAFLIYVVRLAITSALILSPPIILWMYARAGVLAKYTVRTVAGPLALCLFGLIGIMLIIDLLDNAPDFQKAGASIAEIALFYGTQMAPWTVILLPLALLLALLFGLGKMSRSNEIISMLTSGRSIIGILAPVFGIGFYASFISLVLNFYWAPHADGEKESLKLAITEGHRQKTSAVNHRHFNAADNREWFIGSIPFDLSKKNPKNIEITELDADGNLLRRYFARSAGWFKTIDTWTLYGAKIVNYDHNEVPIPVRWEIDENDPEDIELGPFVKSKIRIPGDIETPPWMETPWRILSSTFKAEYLGVQELVSYLRTNRDYPAERLAPFRAQLFDRLAKPWECFVLTLIAAPLGIVFSRRGVMGSVAGSIFLFAGMLFLSGLLLSLGKRGDLAPGISAWGVNISFGLVGAIILYFRAKNRDFPSPRRMLDRWRWHRANAQ